MSAEKATHTPAPKDWACQECGKRMSLKQADRAMSQGCPKCGGTDVDLVEPIIAEAEGAR